MVQVRQSSQLTSVFAGQTSSSDVIHSGTPSLYYEYSREWAIGTGLVQNYDYSSKYYAGKSQEYANSILTDTGFIAVSESITNINAVANDLTNIDLVAGGLTNIDSVAADLTNIDNLSADLTNIDSVASNSANINACVSNASNINTVAGSIANINTVAGDKTNIDTVAGISGNVITVAGISTDVTSVASISSAVSAVNTNASNINAVSNDLTNINSVASDLTNIDSVVGMSSAITTVNSNSTNINTCAANISTIADKVSKSGDTMTGDLSIRNTQPKIFYYDNAFNIFGGVYGGYASSSIKVITLVAGAASSGSSGAYLNLRYDTSTSKDGVTASTGVKQSITNWAYPSSRYDDLTLGASGTSYTAPSDGFVYLCGTQIDYNGFVFLQNNANGLQIVSQPTNVNTFEIRVWIPIAKGDSYRVDYGGVNVNDFRFIYANGEA